MLEQMARHWWTLAARGALAVLFGIIAFLAPGAFAATFALLLGAYFFVDGVFALFAAFRFGHQDNRWWALIFEGIFGVLAGILTFINPLGTAVALVYLVAAWALITGVMEIVAAVQLRRVLENDWLLGAIGVLSVLLGLSLFAHPGPALVAGAYLIGLYAFFFGILMIMLAFRLRRLAPPTTPNSLTL